MFLPVLLLRVSPPRLNGEIEIDLTNPFLGDGGPAKLGAPKLRVPEAKLPPKPVDEPVKPEVKPTDAPKEWTLKTSETQKVEAPAPQAATQGGTDDGTGTTHKVGGSGEGSDYGVPGGTGGGGGKVDVRPRLLNLDEVLRNLRKYYPEAERRAGREADVMVALHIASDGSITGVDIVDSGGKAFDQAAAQVARLMRFSPALKRNTPVAVKMNAPMQFRLTDE